MLVSTLDGKLSAINSSGHLSWEIETGPGPLLISNIHQLEVNLIPMKRALWFKFAFSQS